MAAVRVFEAGGYRYVPGVFQYSGGVAAEPGFEIERARLAQPLPLRDGFALVEAHLAKVGRPSTAFAACELRSPEPFTEPGFREFNRRYVTTLARWGIFRDDENPVARTNVCPVYDKPAGPSLYAFSYTVPSERERGGFIVAGSGEAIEQDGSFRDRTVRLGDVSLDGLRAKVRFVMGKMEERLAALGFGWEHALSTQAYTVQDIGPLVGAEFAKVGATGGGLAWHFCRPPVVDIEFEMDVRGAVREVLV